MTTPYRNRMASATVQIRSEVELERYRKEENALLAELTGKMSKGEELRRRRRLAEIEQAINEFVK
jgi:hypothetical protein